MLLTLQENGKTFFYPPQDFATFFYQAGVDFYSSDGMRNQLSEEAAIEPFEASAAIDGIQFASRCTDVY